MTDYDRILTVRVHRALQGTPPARLELETFGWQKAAGQPGRLGRQAVTFGSGGGPVLLALSERGGIMNEQAMLVIRSDRPVVTGRRGAVTRRLEGLVRRS